MAWFEERIVGDLDEQVIETLTLRYRKLGPLAKASLKPKKKIANVEQYIARYQEA